MRQRPLQVGVVLMAESGGGAAVAIERLLALMAGPEVAFHALGNNLHWIQSAYVDDDRRLILPDATPGSLGSSRRALASAGTLIRTLLAVRHHSREHPTLVLLSFLTGTSLVTLAATLRLPNSVIVCERNDPSRQRHGWHVELLKRVLYPRASAITLNAPSRAAREHLVRVSRGRPVHFVSNPRPRGIAPAEVRSSRMILSVGRLVPQKRHATLIEAFAQVHVRIPEWTLRIVGDGPLHQHLGELIERHGLGDKIELVRRANIPEQLYAEAGLFVLASDYEGTSNALLEAASAGLPCIVSEETAPPSTDDILMSVPAGSAEALARSILTACANDDRREGLGRAAQRWVRQVSDDDVLAEWMSVIQSAHGPRGRTA